MTANNDILEIANYLTRLPEADQAIAVANILGCADDMITSLISAIDVLVDSAGITHAKFAVLAHAIANARAEDGVI